MDEMAYAPTRLLEIACALARVPRCEHHILPFLLLAPYRLRTALHFERNTRFPGSSTYFRQQTDKIHFRKRSRASGLSPTQLNKPTS